MHYWFKSNGDFAEWVDFAYWWSFIGERSASAACAAGLFISGGTLSSLDDDNEIFTFIGLGRVMMIIMVILKLKLTVGELEG